MLAGCASSPKPTPDAPAAERTTEPSAAEHTTEPSAAKPGVAAPVPRKPAYVLKRGGAYYLDDGPGEDPPPDLDAVAEPEPKLEPLHRFANNPYQVFGNDYAPRQQLEPYRKRGVASWYGRRFNGKPTSSGEPYDMYAMSAAHPTLPIPSYARVTNLENGRSVVVRINDRGPFHSGRLIDLSYTAAHKLGYADRGSARVEVESILPQTAIDRSDATRAVAISRERAQATRPATRAAPDPPAQAAPPDRQSDLLAYLPGAGTGTVAIDPAPAARPPKPIYFQLGAFSDRENAETLRARVMTAISELADKLAVRTGDGLFRVHAGPFPSGPEANRVAERILGIFGIRALPIVR